MAKVSGQGRFYRCVSGKNVIIRGSRTGDGSVTDEKV